MPLLNRKSNLLYTRSAGCPGTGDSEFAMTCSACLMSRLLGPTFTVQCRSYAMYLASWGYAVLQYDTPTFSLVQDTVEVCASLPF